MRLNIQECVALIVAISSLIVSLFGIYYSRKTTRFNLRNTLLQNEVINKARFISDVYKKIEDKNIFVVGISDFNQGNISNSKSLLNDTYNLLNKRFIIGEVISEKPNDVDMLFIAKQKKLTDDNVQSIIIKNIKTRLTIKTTFFWRLINFEGSEKEQEIIREIEIRNFYNFYQFNENIKKYIEDFNLDTFISKIKKEVGKISCQINIGYDTELCVMNTRTSDDNIVVDKVDKEYLVIKENAFIKMIRFPITVNNETLKNIVNVQGKSMKISETINKIIMPSFDNYYEFEKIIEQEMLEFDRVTFEDRIKYLDVEQVVEYDELHKYGLIISKSNESIFYNKDDKAMQIFDGRAINYISCYFKE